MHEVPVFRQKRRFSCQRDRLAFWCERERTKDQGVFWCHTKIFMKALYVDSLEVFDVDVAYDILDDMIGESDIGMREYRL